MLLTKLLVTGVYKQTGRRLLLPVLSLGKLNLVKCLRWMGEELYPRQGLEMSARILTQCGTDPAEPGSVSGHTGHSHTAVTLTLAKDSKSSTRVCNTKSKLQRETFSLQELNPLFKSAQKFLASELML